jgi:3-hydroxyisobutyrate dehydrogenase-like beta-hydroxyacid dehydrogenase
VSALSGQHIGFIGLGLMGQPMARNLHAAGAAMVVHNRSPAAMLRLHALGMAQAASPAELARACDSVVLMLTDTPAVEQVIAGPGGVLETLRAGALLIDMGTTAVSVTRALAASVRERGAGYVDAPVSGGVAGAEAASLAIMAGAAEQDYRRALPILERLGSTITHVGDVGAGQVAKAANQVIVGLNIGALAEALALARRAGVDPARVHEAIRGGFAASRVLEVHGRRMIENDFEPGARCTTQHKDMSQALALAAQLGLELPATALNRDLYQRAMDAGFGALDHSALLRILDPER